MRISARGMRVSRWVGAILSLLIAGVCTPSAARAGCSSHYVTSRIQASLDGSEFSLLTGSQSDAAVVATPAKDPARPCTGAFCSGNPALPDSAAPRLLNDGAGQWALLAALLDVPAARPGLQPPFEHGLRPIDAAGSLLRPPRLSWAIVTF